MNIDSIDKFGHCVFCHKYLITKRVVDGEVIEMFTPDHGHTDFMLNNGSVMKVCMCTNCRENIDLSKSSIQSMIMDACMKGWELETKTLIADQTQPMWTEEFGFKYLFDMKKLDIHCHAEGLDKNHLHIKSKELSEIFRAKEQEVKYVPNIDS